MQHIAIVSAVTEELAGLDTSYLNKIVLISQLGVGNLESAISLIQLLNCNPSITEVIFIGSAGSYDPTVCPFPSYAFGTSYHYIEYSSFIGYSHVPEILPSYTKPRIGEVGHKLMSMLGYPRFSVNCPNSLSKINWNPQIGNVLGNLDYSDSNDNNIILENMECFGLSLVCSKMNKGFSSIFSITNQVGENGSKNWIENYKSMSVILNKQLLVAISKLVCLTKE